MVQRKKEKTPIFRRLGEHDLVVGLGEVGEGGFIHQLQPLKLQRKDEGSVLD